MPAFSRFHRYFLAVGRLGSIRRAADALHISASAIDRQILAAEAELGMPLFERLPNGLRLTAAGEVMMAAATRWEKGLGDVRAQMDDLRGLRRGRVELAVIDALAQGFVPRTIAALRADYPGITLATRVLDNVAVRGAVVEGTVECGLLLDPQSGRDLAVRAHVDVVLGFVTPPGHPLTEAPTRRFAAGAAWPLVVPAAPLALTRQVALLEATTGVPMQTVAASDNILMLKSLVAEGVGVGILTSIDVLEEVRRGSLAFVPIAEPMLRPLTLALCMASARSLSGAANLVLARIEAGLAELAAPS